MPASTRQHTLQPHSVIWVVLAANALAWIIAAAFAWVYLSREMGIAIVFLGALAVVLVMVILRWSENRRWVQPLQRLARQVEVLKDDPEHTLETTAAPQIAEMARALRELQSRLRDVSRQGVGDPALLPRANESGEFVSMSLSVDPLLTASGVYLSDSGDSGVISPQSSIPTDYVARLDPTTFRWIDSSPGERAWLGATLETLRGLCYFDLIHPDDRAEAESKIRKAVAKGEAQGLTYRIRTPRHEEKEVFVSISVRYAKDLRPRYVRLTSTDVTEKVKAETELRQRAQELANLNTQLQRINHDLNELTKRYTDLYQNAPVMYVALDHKCRFLECNQTFVKLLGYRKENLIGRSIKEIVPPAHRAGLPRWFDLLAGKGKAETAMKWIKADGDVIDVWLASTAVRRENGSLAYSRNVASDETERKRLEAEVRIKNEQLEQAIIELSAKNKELDQFGYVVSHDLQEPVRTLINFSDFLLADYGDRLDETASEYLHYLVDASRRLRSLIRDLLDLSRAGRVTSDFAPVEVGRVAQLVRDDLAALVQSKNGVIIISEPLPTVWGDQVRIHQLLGNLVGNALKYNKTDRPTVVVSGRVEESGLAVISVKDNGIGIRAESRKKIFELFRQLHPRGEYEGTGAGLAICLAIAKAHGGSIEVEAPVEGGSDFLVRLPTQPSPARPSTVFEEEEEDLGGPGG